MGFLETYILSALLERHGHDDARVLIAAFCWGLVLLAIAFIVALEAGWLDGFIRAMAGVR